MKNQKQSIYSKICNITFLIITIGIVFWGTGTTSSAMEEQVTLTPTPPAEQITLTPTPTEEAIHEHKGDVVEVMVQPTCQDLGLAQCSCNICGEIYYENIAKTTHHYTTTTTKATMYSSGYIRKSCNYCGEIAQNTTIPMLKSITLSKTSYTYNGKACKPKVNIKDSNGKKFSSKYYKLTYKSNKNPGTAKVIVSLKGNYSGQHTLEFNISLKNTKITSIKGKQSAFTLKWKKSTNISGYEVAYSTSPQMDSTIIKKAKKNKTSFTVNNLIGGINYYVSIRSYKTYSGKKAYSYWSKPKKIFVTSKPWQQMSYEEQVVFLVNRERTAKGLLPLMTEENLQKASTIRGEEIVTSFSHTRPNGTSCFTTLKECKVTYRSVGENIAAGYRTPEAVVVGWMNSPGHRANILNSGFRKIGVGYVNAPGTIYTHYWVQMFTS